MEARSFILIIVGIMIKAFVFVEGDDHCFKVIEIIEGLDSCG